MEPTGSSIRLTVSAAVALAATATSMKAYWMPPSIWRLSSMVSA
jgi:hypothetical protein